MKKAYITSRLFLTFMIMVFLIIAVPPLFARIFEVTHTSSFYPVYSEKGYIATFPKQLESINNEAFAETPFETVILNQNLAYIGERAFENAVLLKNVFVPSNTTYIGKNAFPSGILIHCRENSYAQAWSEENGYQYTLDYIWYDSESLQSIYLKQLLTTLWFILPIDTTKLEIIRRRMKESVRSMRPQDRPELHCIDYRFP